MAIKISEKKEQKAPLKAWAVCSECGRPRGFSMYCPFCARDGKKVCAYTSGSGESYPVTYRTFPLLGDGSGWSWKDRRVDCVQCLREQKAGDRSKDGIGMCDYCGEAGYNCPRADFEVCICAGCCAAAKQSVRRHDTAKLVSHVIGSVP